MEIGDHTGSIQELINLTENLDCYDIYPCLLYTSTAQAGKTAEATAKAAKKTAQESKRTALFLKRHWKGALIAVSYTHLDVYKRQYEKNGQPLEVFLGHLIQNKFIRPKVRIYQTCLLYTSLVAPCSSEKRFHRHVILKDRTSSLLLK